MVGRVGLDEYRDEAEFVWPHWESALRHGALSLPYFTNGLDERLLASQEALGRAPPRALDAWFDEALESPPEGMRTAVLALAMLTSGDSANRAKIATAIDRAPAHRAQVVRALALCWHDIDGDLLRWLRAASSAGALAAVLHALAQRAFPLGIELENILRVPEPRIRAAALGCTPAATFPFSHWIEANLRDPDPLVQQAALEAGLWSGLVAAMGEARTACAHRDQPLPALALVALATTARHDDLDRLAAAIPELSLRRQAVWALGFSGAPRAAEILASLLDDPLVADLAAEGFEAITGVRLAATPLPPQDDLPDDDDSVVARPPPSPLPAGDMRWVAPGLSAPVVFNAQTASAVLKAQRPGGGGSSERLFRGVPMTANSIASALARESLRRRHVHALEVAARSRGSARLATRTWGWQQMRTTSAFKIPGGLDFQGRWERG